MRSRRTTLPLLALGAVTLGACGVDAVAESPVDSTGVSTVALTELAALDPLSTVPSSTAAASLEPIDVAIVGDSLTLSAQDEIVAALDAVDVGIVGIDAMEGRRTAVAVDGLPSGVDAVATLAGEHSADVWVIALGTNDVGGQADADSFRADVLELLAELPDDTPVVWLDTWIEDRVAGAQALNAELRAVAARRGNMTVVDWFQFGDDPGVIVGDGVHLTDAGQLKFAEQIAAAVRRSR